MSKENWCKELHTQTKARVSSVSIVSTKDTQRVNQLCDFFYKVPAYHSKNSKTLPSQVVKWDISEGLMKATGKNEHGELEWEHMKFPEVDFAERRGGPHEFDQIHPLIYRLLTETPTILITNILANEEILPVMTDVLTAWSQNDSFHDVHNDEGAIGSHIFVMTYDDEVLPLKVRNMANFFRPPFSTENEREKLINDFHSMFPSIKREQDNVEKIVRLTSGLNLTETDNALFKSYLINGNETGTHGFDFSVISNFKLETLKKYPELRVVKPSKHGFNAIGGYNPTKDFIRKYFLTPLKNKSLQEQGIKPPKGLILYGPPGTGKSLLAQALASELDLLMIQIDFNQIRSKHFGETERKLNFILDLIDSCGDILVYMDEVDRFGQRADTNAIDGGTSGNIFSTSLEWLGKEERKAICVGTTNRIEAIDDAMVRPGRFDFAIPQLYPDKESRAEIFKVWCEVKTKLNLTDDINYDELAKLTEWYVGCDIVKIVNLAGTETAYDGRDKTTMDDFKSVIENTALTPPPSNRRDTATHYIELGKKFTSDKRLFKLLTDGLNISKNSVSSGKTRKGKGLSSNDVDLFDDFDE